MSIQTSSSLNKPTGRGSEIRSLTGLRGLAAVYVVFYHYCPPAEFRTPGQVFVVHGYLAVDLFFALSGFVMALSYTGLFRPGLRWSACRTFFARRIARVFPLYLVAFLLQLALLRFRFGQPTRSLLNHVTLSNALLLQNWVAAPSLLIPAWSLSAEMFAYLLLPVAILAIFFRTTRVAWYMLALAAGGISVLFFYRLIFESAGKTLDVFEGVPSLVRCVTEFLLGMLACRSMSTRVGHWLAETPPVCLALAVCAGTLLFVRYADLALVLLFPVLIISLSGRRNPVSAALGCAPLEWLGQVSYGIYLLHPAFGILNAALRLRLQRAGVQDAGVVSTGLTLLVGILPTAALANRAIERPGSRLLRRALERPRPVSAAAAATR